MSKPAEISTVDGKAWKTTGDFFLFEVVPEGLSGSLVSEFLAARKGPAFVGKLHGMLRIFNIVFKLWFLIFSPLLQLFADIVWCLSQSYSSHFERIM